MEQKNKKIIAIAFVALVILAGIVVINIMGFNKELKFEQSQSFDIYTEQKVDNHKLQEIIDEFLGTNNMVQTIEVYEDMFTIRAKSITDEQKNNIINKVKESYEFEQKAEETTIETIPSTRIRDMYKRYVLPFAISGIAVLIYMAIRYYKKGVFKVIARTICIPVLGQLFLLSVIAITRIPVGRLTLFLSIVMYVITILFVINQNEK